MNELQQKLARRRSLNGESIDPSVAAAARESVRVGKPVSPTKSDAGPETTVITAVTVAETPTVLSPRPESGEEKSSEKNNAPVDTSQALKLDKNEKELVVDVLKGEDEVAGEESNTTKKTQHNLTDSSAGLADLEKEDTEETLVDTYSTERTSDENSDCVVAVVNSTTSAPLFTEEITLVANRLQVMPSSVKLEKLIEELTTTDVSESSNLNASERSQLEAKAVLSKVESITTNDHPLRLTFLYSSSQNRANSDSEYDYESGKFSSNSSRTASERLAGDDGVINAAYRGYITSMDALINSRGESVKIDRKPWTPVVDFVKSRLPVKSPKRPFPTLSYHDHENSSIGSTSSHNNVANAKPMDNTDKAISDEPTKKKTNNEVSATEIVAINANKSMKRNDNSDADSEEETEDDRKDLLNYGTDTFGVNFSKQIKQKRGSSRITDVKETLKQRLSGLGFSSKYVTGEGLLDDLTDLNQEVISALHTQLPRITEENDTDAAIGPSQGQENLANVVPDPFKDILAGMDEIEQVLEAPKEPLQIRRSHPSTINSQDNKLVFSEPENRYSYDGPFFSESASPFEDGLERAIRHNSKDRASRNKEIDERTLSAYLDYTSNIDSFESEFQGDRLSQASKTDMDGAINLLIGNAGKMYGADDSLNAFSQSTMEKELERSLFITNERSGQIEKNENAQRKAQNSKIQRKLDKSGLFSKSLEGHDQQSEDSNDDGPTDKAITPGSIKRSSKLFDDDEDDTDHGDDIHAIVKAGALKRASNYDANLPTVREGDGEKASERKDMEYQEFIDRFSKCADMIDLTKRFLNSILGPYGDATPPPKKAKNLNYVFYGTHRMEDRCRGFFDDVQNSFLSHNLWKDESEERLIAARDCLEQYVMSRISLLAFTLCEVPEEDEKLLKRIKLLSFLKPEYLDIKPEWFNETMLAMAVEELRKINHFRTPGDKVNCVVKAAAIVFRSLSLSRSKMDTEKDESLTQNSIKDDTDSSLAGADDFLPLFIWVVLHAKVPKLVSNCEYIQRYLNPTRLMNKPGYCLINLRSAVEFLLYIEADSLNIDPEEFNQKLAEAEREFR